MNTEVVPMGQEADRMLYLPFRNLRECARLFLEGEVSDAVRSGFRADMSGPVRHVSDRIWWTIAFRMRVPAWRMISHR